MHLERKWLPPFCTRSLIGAIIDNGSLVLGSPFSGFPLHLVLSVEDGVYENVLITSTTLLSYPFKILQQERQAA